MTFSSLGSLANEVFTLAFVRLFEDVLDRF